METKLAIFKGKAIRRTLHDDELWFAIADIVEVLTASADLRQYIKKMRQRDSELNFYWGTICTPLPLPKTEPFKRWLAKVGYERVQEIEDPELAGKRTKAICRAKGYSDAWIEKRMRGIAVRAELTDERQKRGIKEDPEYAILTSEISKAAFGLNPSEYKNLKGLQRENLRDHMTDLELIFSMLGEAATTEIARKQDAQGFNENKTSAKKGGKIAGSARKKLEIETGDKVVSSENYLSEPESGKRLNGRK